MSITVYTPSNEESDRMLAMMEKWITALKAKNVSSDIAAYIARDMLSPMRIRPLESDGVQSHDTSLPNQQLTANGYVVKEST